MTTPGGPQGPGPQPTGDPHRPPAAAAPQGPPPGWGPQPLPGPWPPGAPRASGDHDRTARTIGIIALVVGSIALLGQLLSMVFPFILFGGLMGGLGGEWDEGPVSMGSSGYPGRATPAADGSMSGTALRDGLVRAARDAGDVHGSPATIRCDDVPEVARDVSVLCRDTGARWFAVIRFTGGDGSFVVLTMNELEEPW